MEQVACPAHGICQAANFPGTFCPSSELELEPLPGTSLGGTLRLLIRICAARAGFWRRTPRGAVRAVQSAAPTICLRPYRAEHGSCTGISHGLLAWTGRRRRVLVASQYALQLSCLAP